MTPSIAVQVITDGRTEYLARTVDAAMRMLRGPIVEWWMYDDTGDNVHRRIQQRQYPEFRHVDGGPRRGFGGAIQMSWANLTHNSTADYVFHLEQDFQLTRPVDLGALAAVLAARPYLVQMALRRQPWSEAEHRAGGVVEMHPGEYTEVTEWIPDGGPDTSPATWLEHRVFFTTNPCLYRRTLCYRGWPHGAKSEGRFTLGLFEDGTPGVAGPDLRMGYWGARESGVWAEHIGHQRIGRGY